MIKRIFDFIISLTGIILLSPIFVIVALMVRLDSKGPVFYKGKRAGWHGSVFGMYKFRTMVPNAEKIGGPSTPIDDSRLTKIGGMLKRYQLDELPQLVNVLKGEMSFVGPRPEVEIYIDKLSKEKRKKILSVRPGMTDFASLWNFHEGDVLKESNDPEKDYLEKIRPKKVELQLKYIDEKSFWLDIKLILKTIAKIFK